MGHIILSHGDILAGRRLLPFPPPAGSPFHHNSTTRYRPFSRIIQDSKFALDDILVSLAKMGKLYRIGVIGDFSEEK